MHRRWRATAFLPRWATSVRFELILPRVGMDAVRAVAVSALTSPSRMATRSARRDARAVGMTSWRHPSPSTGSLIACDEALPGLSRPFARRTSTADRPAHYYGGGQGRRVAAEVPGEGPTTDGPRFLTVAVKGSGLSANSLARDTRAGPAGRRPHPGAVHHRDGGLPEGVRGAEVTRREVRNGGARVPLGLYRSVPGS